MNTIKKFLAAASAAFAVTGAVVIISGPTVTASAASSSCWEAKPEERGFARKINKERGNRSVGKLRLDPELSKVARRHNRKMVGEDYLHHNPKLDRWVTNWSIIGENVGVGATVDSLHQAFMESDGHRLNILYRDYRYVGIGTRTDDDGRLWVTVVFEGQTDPGTKLRMPSC